MANILLDPLIGSCHMKIVILLGRDWLVGLLLFNYFICNKEKLKINNS